jgi:hypothetical protein
MDRLIQDAPLRQRMGARAREVTNRFGREVFYKRWDRVLWASDSKSDR